MHEKLVLVTGASGYIAAHIVQQLLRAGYRVRGTVRSLTNPAKVAPLCKLVPEAKYPLELVEANLLRAEGWEAAARGCDYVLHVASPIVTEEPEDENDVIKPAVEGTLHVLRAAQASGTVKRVVFTGSMSAIRDGYAWDQDKVHSHTDWTDPDKPGVGAYSRSKTLAERAAWEFVQQEKTCGFELTVINVGVVVGPVLSSNFTPSSDVINLFLERKFPIVAPMYFTYTDVRDVAKIHISAMTSSKAANQRYLLCAEGMWTQDICDMLREDFSSQGYNPPSYVPPYWLFWLYSFFNKKVAKILPILHKPFHFDNSLIMNDLEIKPIPIKQSIIDMAYSMIENGLTPKTEKYKCRK